MNRDQRRKTAIKGKNYYGELTHKLAIAELRVYTNSSVPDGVMIVSPKEADRLQALVDEASAKATAEKINKQVKDGETAENPEEGK